MKIFKKLAAGLVLTGSLTATAIGQPVTSAAALTSSTMGLTTSTMGMTTSTATSATLATTIVAASTTSVPAPTVSDTVLTTSSTGMMPCVDMPVGDLTVEQLKSLVPDGSLGRVRIAWSTESQEETYGFNIMRADQREGTYEKINAIIIPGEGSTNIPKKYCYEDRGVKRGETYYYRIEEVTNSGSTGIVEGTDGTMVKVKTVEEERTSIKNKAAAAAAESAAGLDATTVAP